MKRILYPDHTAAIAGVPELMQDFAAANGLEASRYELSDLQKLLASEGTASSEFAAWLQESPIALLSVPTTVRIDERLLRLTEAEAFATASTGTDHVDFSSLEREGLPYFSAPGENALSVVEYVLAALPLLFDPDRLCKAEGDFSLGIVGYGRIGGALGAVAHRLGWTVRAYDPPLFHSTEDDLHSVLQSDVITFHVPLTKEGRHATRGMITDTFLDQANPSSVWINAARGPVITPETLLRLCSEFRTVIDVFPSEPARPEWLEKATLVSPHVAGYSWKARFAGVFRVLQSFAVARSLRMPFRIEDYRPERFALSGLDFLEAESQSLKSDPDSFSERRNRYPTRSSIRDEMELGRLEGLSGLNAGSPHGRYFGRIFEAWNELHLY
ncbi:NAD(P)-dependent oxidoreductase [Leptonema illini]|uniref:D-isomer specific 2-hydroxyacid dehydrogenase NAD-binding n=1 Tax=Leptonema illini DSM 21528 TaxID=929563 RepID=H2CHS6_9LEPT|nr:NAD(P)-dependent oxidoreductase [Leptonema illini]EHQ05921.1 D-isomer specific 2-hydroxyacid dehydrogenase NAD-binding [Leptonema illini DSM 21528]